MSQRRVAVPGAPETGGTCGAHDGATLHNGQHEHEHRNQHQHQNQHQAPQSRLAEGEVEEEDAHFARILRAFSSYALCNRRTLEKHARDFGRIAPEHQALLPDYLGKISRAQLCLAANQDFFAAVVAPHAAAAAAGAGSPDDADRDGDGGAAAAAGLLVTGQSGRQISMRAERMQSVVLTRTESENLLSLLRQVVRDWSAEVAVLCGQPLTLQGAPERRSCYGPILAALAESFPSDGRDRDRHPRVLVPGAGLGRLAYEISQLGFECQGNEFSLFMLLTSEMFLTRDIAPGALTIHPHALSFSNTVRIADQLAAVSVPDVAVRAAAADFSMVAGDFTEIYADTRAAWDCIVTCYFIDTAKNIVEYISLIHQLLVPGGVWINSGPLLYHFEGHVHEPSIELSVEEIRAVCAGIGLVLEEERFVASSYAQNSLSLHQTAYTCWFFRARKH